LNKLLRVGLLMVLATALAAPAGAPGSIAIAVVGAPPPPSTGKSQAPDACDDNAYTTIAAPWTKTLKWYYKTSSTPSYLASSGVVTVLKNSFVNMTRADNDCGLADNVSATASYQGSTTFGPSVNKRGNCTASDGRNVIGFGNLPSGILAVTCIRMGAGNHIIEADIRINTDMDWELVAANCNWEELLEPTMTHEIGHAFGLGHVGEKKHGRLTMSTISDGPCSNAESSLGWGDVRGMHHLYP
jgi:matrixin